MRAHELLDFWAGQGWPLAEPEGFRVNSPEVEVAGIFITWLPSRRAIQAAADAHCNLIIAREQFNFPPDYSGAALEHHLSDRVSLPRFRALLDRGMAVFRAQGSLDALHRAALAAQIGLAAPDAGGLVNLGAPMLAADLATAAWQGLDRPPMRVAGELRRPVSRIGVLHGSTGCAHNLDGLLPLLARGAEAILAGELDEYPIRAALDMAVSVILVGQAASLAPGFRSLAAALRECYRRTPVVVDEGEPVWQAL